MLDQLQEMHNAWEGGPGGQQSEAARHMTETLRQLGMLGLWTFVGRRPASSSERKQIAIERGTVGMVIVDRADGQGVTQVRGPIRAYVTMLMGRYQFACE